MESVNYQTAAIAIDILLMAALMWAGIKAFFMGLRTTGVLVFSGSALSLAGGAGYFLTPEAPKTETLSTPLLVFTALGHVILAIGILRLVLLMDRREVTSDTQP